MEQGKITFGQSLWLNKYKPGTQGYGPGSEDDGCWELAKVCPGPRTAPPRPGMPPSLKEDCRSGLEYQAFEKGKIQFGRSLWLNKYKPRA